VESGIIVHLKGLQEFDAIEYCGVS